MLAQRQRAKAPHGGMPQHQSLKDNRRATFPRTSCLAPIDELGWHRLQVRGYPLRQEAPVIHVPDQAMQPLGNCCIGPPQNR